jgi:prepilin-type N-terminal cleavage/methylation domain-containing protein/prepilin-type processing-associated H-X9-DG protein
MNTPSLSSYTFKTVRAFTLLELLAVIAMICVLASLVTPTLARTRHGTRALQCLNNLHQIVGAISLYAQDYHDLFPPNPDDGTTIPGYTWCTGQGGIGGADEFNPDLLRDPFRTLVTPYARGQVQIFNCTDDPRVGLYNSAILYPTSPLIGTKVRAARSVSMNQAVGTIDPAFAGGGGHSGKPTLPTNGPWLTGSYRGNNAQTGPWRTYGKTSQMSSPTPARLWVITEESLYSLNDASFAMSVGQPKWVDYPSLQHNRGCVIAFGDGHSELHKWLSPTTDLSSPARLPVSPNDVDWQWFATRTSALLRQ